MQLTARVPFDERRALNARLENLREGHVREFLQDVRSGLVDEPDVRAVYRHARLSYRINDHGIPPNVALLFFTDDPEQWFRGARIEIAQFADGAAGNVLEEKIFRGPAHEQIRQCLGYLENFATHHLEKFETVPKPAVGSATRAWRCANRSSMRFTTEATTASSSRPRSIFTRIALRLSAIRARSRESTWSSSIKAEYHSPCRCVIVASESS